MTERVAALEVNGLSVNYGGVAALTDVDLVVPDGSVTGLIGPNGAGKTTFIDAVSGFTAASGAVRLRGEAVEGLAPHRRAQRGLARTFQSLELFDDLSVRENLIVAAGAPTWRSTVADLFRVDRRRDERVDRVLDLLGVHELADTAPAALSNGQRHLVALGRALVADPVLVLLDEPAAGLDPAETTRLAEVIARIPTLGAAVLLVDHDMSLVFQVCATVAVLDFGRLIAHGAPDAVRADDQVVAAYLGGEAS